MKTFHQLLAADPSVSPAFSSLFADPVECDWCGCMTHSPIALNGLQFAPACLPAYEADQAEAGFDHSDGIDPDLPDIDVRMLRMRRKQAGRETGAELGIEEVA